VPISVEGLGDLLETGALLGEALAQADLVVVADQDRVGETEPFDAVGDLPKLRIVD